MRSIPAGSAGDMETEVAPLIQSFEIDMQPGDAGGKDD